MIITKGEMAQLEPEKHRLVSAGRLHVDRKTSVGLAAEMWGVPKERLDAYLSVHGVLETRGSRRRYDHQLIWDCHSKGMGTPEICKQVGCTRKIVTHVVQLGNARVAEGLPPVQARR